MSPSSRGNDWNGTVDWQRKHPCVSPQLSERAVRIGTPKSEDGATRDNRPKVKFATQVAIALRRNEVSEINTIAGEHVTVFLSEAYFSSTLLRLLLSG